MASTRLYLARHAEQDPTADEAADPGLSPLGKRQARSLGQRLAGVRLDGIRYGPARRTTETARIVAAALPGVRARESAQLRDRTPTAGPGDDYPDWFDRWAADVPEAERDPGGAALRAVVEHFATAPEGALLLVTHSFVVAWFVRSALDAPVPSWVRLAPAHTGLTTIDHEPGRPPRLVAVNDTGHLLDLDGQVRTGR